MAIDRETGDKEGESGLLYQLGLLAKQQEKFTEAEDFYNQALAIDRETGDKEGESGLLYQLGLLAKQQEKFTEAEDFYNQALEINRELLYKSGESLMLYRLGLLAKQQEKFAEAEDFYNQALEFYRETGDNHGEGFILRRLGNLCEQMDDFHKAYGLFSQSLEVYQSINDQNKESQLHINLGDVSAEGFDIETSKIHYEKSISIWENMNDLPQLSVAYNRLAELYLKTGQFDEALEITEQSRKIDLETDDKRGLLINGLFAGEAWLGKKTYVKARTCFEKGYHDAIKNEDFLLQAMFAVGMSTMLFQLGSVEEGRYWSNISEQVTKDESLLNLDSENSRFTRRAIRLLKLKHAPEFSVSQEDKSNDKKSSFSGLAPELNHQKVVVDSQEKPNLVPDSLGLSLEKIMENHASIHIDTNGMNFFANKDQISDLLQPYVSSTTVRQPIHLVMLLEEKDNIEYHIVDGVRRFYILVAALIEAFNKSGMDLPVAYNRIFYQDKEANGTVVDLLKRRDDSGEDVKSFLSNVSLALETIIEEGHAVDDIIERISTGLIRATLFTAEKAH